MKQLILKLIRLYQTLPLPSSCRFAPTCSEYTYQAVEKYGVSKGAVLGIKRIVRCHPWSKGGLDPLR
ncbi:MAG: membrane protein insertion efficiency factor YidD [Patescibacteria group bacterium]